MEWAIVAIDHAGFGYCSRDGGVEFVLSFRGERIERCALGQWITWRMSSPDAFLPKETI